MKSALSIASGLLVGASIAAVVSIVGFFDTRFAYCDYATKPCTNVVVPAWYKSNVPETARVLTGAGLTRTIAGLLGMGMTGLSIVIATNAAHDQATLEEENFQTKVLEEARTQILQGEELQKLGIASSLRVQDFKRELQDGYAYLYLEKNPHLIDELTRKPQPISAGNEEEETPEPGQQEVTDNEEPSLPQLLGIELPEPPELGVTFWDWRWFQTRANDLPHIRVVAPTNGGKTTLTDFLLDVVPAERRLILTIKRKPHQWKQLEVYGVPEDYTTIRNWLEACRAERVRRTADMAKGIDFPPWSVGVDEWRAIAKNIKAIKDPETKEVISPSAKEVMGEMITLARETKIRIFALAQGKQVHTWGLEGESDLAECFTSVYLGQFAVEQAESVRNKYKADSPEYMTWQRVVDYLKTLEKRAAWVDCEFGSYPAINLNLSGWSRVIPQEESVVELQEESATLLPEDPEDLWEKAKQRFEQTLSSSPATAPQENSHPEVVKESDRPPESSQPPPLETLDIEQVSPEESQQESSPTASKLYTPQQLGIDQLIPVILAMLNQGISETKTIETLWQVKKNKSGWKQAYKEFRELKHSGALNKEI